MAEIELHSVVNVLCDDEKVLQGTYVGEAIIFDDDKPIRKMVINLSRSRFILTEARYDPYDVFVGYKPPDGIIEPITEILVDPERVVPAPIYVNVYSVDRGYGGPEEGGWWYETREPVHFERVSSREEAEERREELREQYPNTGKRFSVLGGEDYDIFIQYQEPEPESDYQPYS